MTASERKERRRRRKLREQRRKPTDAEMYDRMVRAEGAAWSEDRAAYEAPRSNQKAPPLRPRLRDSIPS
jgi:hypothetical protein